MTIDIGTPVRVLASIMPDGVEATGCVTAIAGGLAYVAWDSGARQTWFPIDCLDAGQEAAPERQDATSEAVAAELRLYELEADHWTDPMDFFIMAQECAHVEYDALCEIVNDPRLMGCKTFSQLHDHCDANMLGDADKLLDTFPQSQAFDAVNIVQASIDQKLRAMHEASPWLSCIGFEDFDWDDADRGASI